MFSSDDLKAISSFLNENSCPWVWIDILTTMGPTRLEEFFKKRFEGDALNHWSPATPEGYLEITGERNMVIHWMIGEVDKVVNISCVEDVDFDEIDKALTATIIHNSVIRIMSERF